MTDGYSLENIAELGKQLHPIASKLGAVRVLSLQHALVYGTHDDMVASFCGITEIIAEVIPTLQILFDEIDAVIPRMLDVDEEVAV